MQPAIVKVPILFADVLELLTLITGNATHQFWRLDSGVSDIREDIRARIVGHRQLADAVLLDLAIKRKGRFATFDQGVLNLVPRGSTLRSAIVTIGT
jgi:hypothetical protein